MEAPDLPRRRAAAAALLRHFPAAFLGRLVVVPYRPLGEEEIAAIVRLKLGRPARPLRRDPWRRAELDDATIPAAIAARAGQTESGARRVDAIRTHSILPGLAGRRARPHRRRAGLRCRPCRRRATTASSSSSSARERPRAATRAPAARFVLTTTLGPDRLLLETIEGEEHLSAPFRYTADGRRRWPTTSTRPPSWARPPACRLVGDGGDDARAIHGVRDLRQPVGPRPASPSCGPSAVAAVARPATAKSSRAEERARDACRAGAPGAGRRGRRRPPDGHLPAARAAGSYVAASRPGRW